MGTYLVPDPSTSYSACYRGFLSCSECIEVGDEFGFCRVELDRHGRLVETLREEMGNSLSTARAQYTTDHTARTYERVAGLGTTR
jgi:hypothetical protein